MDQREKERKAIIKKDRRHFHENPYRKQVRKLHKTPAEFMEVPVIFSISENADETLRFLKKMEIVISFIFV